MIQMTSFTKEKQIHRHKKKMNVWFTKRGRGGEINKEFGIS